MSEVNMELDNLERLIEQRAEQKINTDCNIKKVAKKKTIDQLKQSEKEITEKYKEAKKLWKKSIELYAEFIKKQPGSKQLNPPSELPEEPKQLDDIRAYIKLFESLIDEELYFEQRFLQEMFKTTSEGIYAAKHTAYLLATAVSGNTVTANWNPQ